ncbi:MAG TPA: aminotransferase class IV [Acetobacteraceae bacterium]|nr:aminotransferase class IV [Acetobacteraceae bacterium]
MIAPDDRGLTLGVGLFETLLVADGRPVDWQAHLDRLAAGCAALALPPPNAEACRAAAARALAEAGLERGRAALRLTWTGGPAGRGLNPPPSPAPVLLATAAPLGPPPTSLRLATSAIRRNPTSPASRHKTLSYLDNTMARAEALARGADEAIMLATDGALACAAAGNLFLVTDGRLLTPALDCGVLAGIMRARVLAAADRLALSPVCARIAADEMWRAGAVLVSNSLIGLVPVSAIDGSAMPAPDATVEALTAACREADEVADPGAG